MQPLCDRASHMLPPPPPSEKYLTICTMFQGFSGLRCVIKWCVEGSEPVTGNYQSMGGKAHDISLQRWTE